MRNDSRTRPPLYLPEKSGLGAGDEFLSKFDASVHTLWRETLIRSSGEPEMQVQRPRMQHGALLLREQRTPGIFESFAAMLT